MSGQSLVPVLVDGDDVVADSPEILDWLEAKHPDPPLYPAEPAARAEAEVFVAWFNTVWKRPPNLLADELSKPEPDARTVAALSSSLARAVTIFERLLSSREYLLGAFGIADVIAFPFLKYAVFGVPEGDDELFHHILVEHQRLSAGSPIRGWVARVDARPRS